MAVKGIQFSEPMVRALLAGRKTQTRRIIDLDKASAPIVDFICVATDKKSGAKIWEMRDKYGASVTLPKGRNFIDYHFKAKIAVHDLLYVREAWHVTKGLDGYSPAKSHNGKPVIPRRGNTIYLPAGGSLANGPDGPGWQESDWPRWEEPMPEWLGKFRQAMHMPRWASRITLEVTEVQIERLKDISREDAIAEGLEWIPPTYGIGGIAESWNGDPRKSYFGLWDHINGLGAADKNPWVIAYSFRVMRGNIDDLIENGTIEIGDPR